MRKTHSHRFSKGPSNMSIQIHREQKQGRHVMKNPCDNCEEHICPRTCALRDALEAQIWTLTHERDAAQAEINKLDKENQRLRREMRHLRKSSH